MKLVFIITAILSLIFCVGFAVTLTLPKEKGEFKKVDLPGYNIAVQKCLICHSQDYIQYQPSSTSRKAWQAEVLKMQKTYGAPITDQEIPLLVDYLAAAYGNSPMTSNTQDPAMKLQNKKPTIEINTNKATDILKQLTENNCLTCHSITNKVVGPAFKEVALKYKNDPNAAKKIMAKIKNGGQGNWGEVPMPPQTQISDSNLNTIAKWVLQQ